MAGFGGVIRDHKGTPIVIYFGSLGWDTNKSDELEGLWQGLLLSQQTGLHPLEIEGDSKILIKMANQILNGAQAQKFASSWCLEARLEEIER